MLKKILLIYVLKILQIAALFLSTSLHAKEISINLGHEVLFGIKKYVTPEVQNSSVFEMFGPQI